MSRPDLGPPTTLLLVRHGTTAHTGRDFTGGAGDQEPLDDQGRRQAEAVAAELGRGRPSRPDRVVASPLRRTRQTADPIAAELALEVEADERWREIPSLDPDVVPPLLDRIAKAREALVAGYPGGTVVVVTHAGPIKAAVAAALDAGPAALWRLRIDPASISTIRYWSDGGVEVAAVNDVAHLR